MAESSAEKAISLQPGFAAYAAGLLVLFASIYSQYFFSYGPLSGLFIIYGIPIIFIAAVFGPSLVKNYFRRTAYSFQYGLAFFAVFTVIGNLLAAAIYYVLSNFDPNSLNLLNQPSPILHQLTKADAWVMVFVSLFVAAPAEEYLFRGFAYGGLLRFFKNTHWLVLAVFSSVLFAAAHLYYYLEYGVASLIILTNIMAIGLAMAFTFYFSGGNLFIPTLIHGVYDAAGFLALAVGVSLSDSVGNLLVGSGIIMAIVIFFQSLNKKKVLK